MKPDGEEASVGQDDGYEGRFAELIRRFWRRAPKSVDRADGPDLDPVQPNPPD